MYVLDNDHYFCVEKHISLTDKRSVFIRYFVTLLALTGKIFYKTERLTNQTARSNNKEEVMMESKH